MPLAETKSRCVPIDEWTMVGIAEIEVRRPNNTTKASFLVILAKTSANVQKVVRQRLCVIKRLSNVS
jgi:hypothetical protein